MLTHCVGLRLLLLVIFCQYPVIGIIQWDLPEGALTCHRAEPDLVLADCTSALEMIPTGLTLDVKKLKRCRQDPDKPIRLEFDKQRRKLPALFNVNSCIIMVVVMGRPAPEQPPVTPHGLYYKLWPKAREAAAIVIQRCLTERQGPGNMRFSFPVNGFRGYIQVDVYRREGRKAPTGGRRQKDIGNSFPLAEHCTVYTPEKLAKYAKAEAAEAAKAAKAAKRLRVG